MDDYLSYLEKRRINNLKREDASIKFASVSIIIMMTLGVVSLVLLAVLKRV